MWATERLPMPAVLCLEDNLEETLGFLGRLRIQMLGEAQRFIDDHRATSVKRSALRRTGNRAYSDFSNMRRISTSAALVLAAIFDRRKHMTGTKLSTVDERRWRPAISDVLLELGFKELLELKARDLPQVSDGPIRTLRFLSGENADGVSVDRLQNSLVAMLPDDEGERLRDTNAYGGILEAILNSHNHAYPDGHRWSHAPLKRWWITGAFDSRSGQVTVVAYDQGVSIPASLPGWEQFGKLERLMAKIAARAGVIEALDSPTYDGMAIRLAMAVARSSTGLPQHGKGLNTMLEVARGAPWGRLRVLSRNGEFVWTTGAKPQARSLAQPLDGTLVEWKLRLR
ncbi:hypothetical protein [Lichenibacterium dinghuense]|uniref:hypothetical protein n=1 Tax=Lichenibacterium dinghuense TaxID=2895977 RepID=UPI001F3FCE7C|nr:hypothetical protein [Lichenibacterium sp. 6Y81]